MLNLGVGRGGLCSLMLADDGEDQAYTPPRTHTIRLNTIFVLICSVIVSREIAALRFMLISPRKPFRRR